jgi:hypothetical protein
MIDKIMKMASFLNCICLLSDIVFKALIKCVKVAKSTIINKKNYLKIEKEAILWISVSVIFVIL